MNSYYQILSKTKISNLAGEKMCKECRGFIKNNSKILDLGCGSGIIGKSFGDYFQSEITGLDIIDQRVQKIPFKLYDGKTIPFPDNSFDVVLVNFVLHHCQDPVHMLNEVKRVAKDKIIIYEDSPEGFLPGLLCRLHGLTFATFFQQNKERGNFKAGKEWGGIFEKLDLKLIFEKKHPFLMRKLFILKKSK